MKRLRQLTQFPRPIKAGDRINWLAGEERQVVDVKPYTGRYPQWFNRVLVLTSPHTRSGTIEMAFDDPHLRKQSGQPQG